jgi:glycosyltransferase involved in cell wall biosynthesis
MRPDIIVVRFWLPFMGPAFGTILRRARKNRVTRVICIADNIKPHERRPGDKVFTRYFLKSCDAFIVMSQRVLGDLQSLKNRKPAILVPHPLYDNFGPKIGKSEARQYLGLPDENRLILFFGFIRRYKGLDLLLEAIKLLKEKHAADNKAPAPPKVLVAGEFYEDEKNYRALIEKWGLEDELVLRTDFIPDAEVKYYFCAADAVIQPYRNATQSGVTPLAYHFEKPMIVTNVGGLPDLVPDGKAGLIVEPQAAGIAAGIVKFYGLGGEDFFIQHLRNEKKKYSWSGMVNTIMQLANDIQK